jgi:acetyl esterase/lipase
MSLPPSRKGPLALLLVVAAFAPTPSSPMGRSAGESASPASADAAQPQVLTYRRVGARPLGAYVFLPKAPGKDRPAVLLFHGGGWRIGEPAWLFDRAKEFAAKGMVAISIEYRLSNDGFSPIDAVEDVRRLRVGSRAGGCLGIDPRRVAGYGSRRAATWWRQRRRCPPSAEGPHEPRRPNALVMFSPALDMARNEYFTELMAGKAIPPGIPAEFVSRSLPPTLVIQGEEDTIVLAGTRGRSAPRRDGRCDVPAPGTLVGHLLTRNLKVQYRTSTAIPPSGADAHRREMPSRFGRLHSSIARRSDASTSRTGRWPDSVSTGGPMADDEGARPGDDGLTDLYTIL